MGPPRPWAVAIAVAGALGCSSGAGPAADAGPLDAGVADAGAIDASRDGATATDATASDAASVDATADGEAPRATRIFVTSTRYDGNLGGLAGGDARCQALADREGLGGTWLAWLGDGTDGPATRFVRSTGEYRLVGGERVAVGWDDLVDGTIEVPLDHDETGTPLPAADDRIVFTAVFHTGGRPTPVSCTAWSTNAPDLVPTGLASRIDTGWTVFAPHPCNEMHHLYCFEQ